MSDQAKNPQPLNEEPKTAQPDDQASKPEQANLPAAEGAGGDEPKEDAATGRGLTSAFVHVDEAGFIPSPPVAAPTPAPAAPQKAVPGRLQATKGAGQGQNPVRAAAAVQAPAAPKVEAKAVAAAPAPAALESFNEVLGIPAVDRLLKDVPAAYTANLAGLKKYIVEMGPKRPVSIEEGVRNQVLLYRAITNTINRQNDHFRPAFTALLRLFVELKDSVFHEAYVFRFMDNINLPENDRKAFQRLLNLIKVLAPVEGREQAKAQINFEASLAYGLTEEGRQRLLAYFNV